MNGIVTGKNVTLKNDPITQRYDLRVEGQLISSDANYDKIMQQADTMGVQWNQDSEAA